MRGGLDLFEQSRIEELGNLRTIGIHSNRRRWIVGSKETPRVIGFFVGKANGW